MSQDVERLSGGDETKLTQIHEDWAGRLAAFLSCKEACLEQESDVWVFKETTTAIPQRLRHWRLNRRSISQQNRQAVRAIKFFFIKSSCYFVHLPPAAKASLSGVLQKMKPWWWQVWAVERTAGVHTFNPTEHRITSLHFSLRLSTDWLANWLAVSVTDGTAAQIQHIQGNALMRHLKPPNQHFSAHRVSRRAPGSSIILIVRLGSRVALLTRSNRPSVKLCRFPKAGVSAWPP